MDIEDVKARWNNYLTEVYHDDRLENDNAHGPTIMKEEVGAAIDDIKARKAIDRGGVAAEFLYSLADFAIDQLTSLVPQIYETGNIETECVIRC